MESGGNKKYHLPGGQEKITATVKELGKVEVKRPAQSPLNSPMWLVEKPNLAHDSRLQRIKQGNTSLSMQQFQTAQPLDPIPLPFRQITVS